MDLLATIGIRTLESMFAAGAIGSFVVIVLSAVEDIETLMGSDEPSHTDV